ncbi:Sodium/hydrogen exchanger family-domain-containing protein [Gautieria morchelliformis]|nr:Sodium/hydrogen exchanger family-domain-containing protein [Gautieria morchelliformis]
MAPQVQLLDLSPVPIAYLSLGGFVVFFSMISLLVKERLYLGESVLATAFGILIGPHGANIFNPRSWSANSNPITLEVMRITLATGLFAIGVELPHGYLGRHWKSLVIMVVPTMAIGWVSSAGFMFVLFPGISFISALCISACLTPTDPILSVAITSGTFAINHVPVNIRHLIAAESAANDGLAYPFLSISIYLTIEASKRTAVGLWFLVGWLYQVIFGIALGAFLGLAFCHIMKYSLRKRFIDRESYVAQYIALAFMSIGLTNLLGSDDLLAAFAAGTAISWDGHFTAQTENAIFSSVIDLVLNCGAFIYIGAWLPFASYNSPELGITPWRLVVLFLCLLALRRLPSLLILYKWVPDIRDWREAVFAGHFGPMGVGAIFISTLAVSKLDQPQLPPRNQEERLAASLHPIVSFVVLGSIIIYGLSIPFFTLSRRTVSLTSTWSRSTTTTKGNPQWLTMTRPISRPVRRPEGDVEVALEQETTIASPVSEAPTSELASQELSSDVVSGSEDTLSRTMTNQSTKTVGFDTSVMVEGRRVFAADVLQLPIAVKQRNEIKRERRRMTLPLTVYPLSE